MTVVVNGARLLEGLKKVTGIANGKSGLAILGNVKVEAKNGILSLTTTNLDMSMYAEVDCVSVKDEGVTTVPMKKFEQTIAVLPVGDVNISVSADDKMVVRCGNAKMTIGGLSAQDFPSLPSTSGSVEYRVKAKTLKNLLRKSSYAMSTDDTRSTLMGVLLDFVGEELKAVSTDGKRLAMSVCKVENSGNDAKYIVPDRAVNALSKLVDGEGDVVIKAEKSQISFTLSDGKQKIYTKLIDGVYPSYENVIPKQFDSSVNIGRGELITAIGRTAVMVSSNNPFVKLNFMNDMLSVDVVGDDNCDAHEELAIKYDGTPQTCVFNPQFLLDTLKAADSDDIVIEMAKPQTPILVKANGESFIGIIMPLRIF